MAETGRRRRALWLTTTLAQAGGGERLLLEGAKYFESQGIETTVATFAFHERALFDGTYQPRLVMLARDEPGSRKSDVARLDYWLRGLLALRRTIARTQPDLLIAQSENSAILLYLATLLSRQPYVLLLFGQMFQFPGDQTKYSLVFRRHLPEICASLAGYRETIPSDPPSWSLGQRLRTEVLALWRYLAVRRADKISTLSDQGRWEIGKLYQKDSLPLQGAYPARIFDYRPGPTVREGLGLPSGRILLAIARLLPKKRIDLAIRAFARLSPQVDDLTLVIGGRGPDEPRLRDLVAELGLGGRVRFTGYIPEPRLWDYYACCDVFLQLDVADFDIVTFEAAALGRKLVLSSDAELADAALVDRLIYRAEPTPEGVAGAVARALAAPTSLLSSAERDALTRYTWESYFGRLLRYLDE